MTDGNWALLNLLSDSIEQCESIEFFPLATNSDFQVFCYCEENRYLCLNASELRSTINICYSKLFCSPLENLKVVTNVLLFYATNCSTSWNFRRRLLNEKRIELNDELSFTEKILSVRPKSEETFRYRRFILKKFDKEKVSIEREFDLCDKTGEKHLINYSSWQHRRWLIDYFNLNVKDELNRHLSFVGKVISDSSSFSFRAFLVSKSNDPKSTIEQELQENEKFIDSFRDRESFWVYRRTLIFLALNKFHFDRNQLLLDELRFTEKIEPNLFTERYSKLIKTLQQTDGMFYRISD